MARRVVPVVGVTTYSEPASWGPWDRPAALVPETYVRSVSGAGGAPVLLPPATHADLAGSARAVVGRIDALVLVGGGDLDPALYGQSPHPATGGVHAGRDGVEFALTDAALAAGLPVLAICRGMQVLNVALGGTLCQHLPDAGHDGHRPGPGCFTDVAVHTEPGSLTAKALGESVVVRCSHHQAVDTLGDGLVVTARAGDDVVEAVELPTASFVLGVQWHPEEELDVRLFRALLDHVA